MKFLASTASQNAKYIFTLLRKQNKKKKQFRRLYAEFLVQFRQLYFACIRLHFMGHK